MKRLAPAAAALLLPAALLACGPAPASPPGPLPVPAAQAAPAPQGQNSDAFVRGLYAKEPAWSTPAERRALFEPALAEALIKDGGDPNEVGAIDFAFTCGCQDGDVTDLGTANQDTAQGAEVTARFKLDGKPTTVLYRLARAGKGWKIADVSAPAQNGDTAWSLRGLLGLDKGRTAP